jgi:hypothetical protein
MGNMFSSAPAQPEPTSPGPVFEEQPQGILGGKKKSRSKTRRGGRKGKGKGKGRK